MVVEASIPILDHGYVRFIEAWGHGDAGEKIEWVLPLASEAGIKHTQDFECGIIEAARQSTQASFRGWEDQKCPDCENGPNLKHYADTGRFPHQCNTCDGKGVIRGDERLLRYLFMNKPPHATPFEFAGMVIEVQAPIFVFREWHRHRTQSYNEMSARYSPLPNTNYIPTVERLMKNSIKNKQAGRIKGADDLDEAGANWYRQSLKDSYTAAESLYQSALKAGVPKELARVHLPVGRYSKMRAQTNLRNWLAFMTLRADPGAQWEIQEYARAVGNIIAEKFPRTWKLYVEGRNAA